MTPIEVQGSCSPAFAPVRDAFRSVFDDLGDTGAATAVIPDGTLVVDLWGGTRDGSAPWLRDTVVHTYSVAKPFAALAALAVVAAGDVPLDGPITAVWPEFGAAGKDATTLRHVLSHQSGCVALREPAAPLTDWDATCAALATMEPWWESGTAMGEHALTYGHLLGEVVRRATGSTLGTVLREQITGPLDIAFTIGTPTMGSIADVVDPTGDWGARLLAAGNDLYRQALGVPAGALDPDVVNSTAWREAEIPAVNGHGTARGIAQLYAAVLDGGRGVIDAGLLAEALTPQVQGHDLVMGDERTWGLGFAIDDRDVGMGGIGGHVGYADLEGRYAVGFVTRTLGGFDRCDAVIAALEGCLGR